jgi:putative solute:sodium symporter small subunit
MQFSTDDVQHRPVASKGVWPPDFHDTHHLWLKAMLLALWVVFSFGVCFFARDLQAWVSDWQLGYWMAAQGAVLMFIGITVVYCLVMNMFERDSAKRDQSLSAAPKPLHADSPRR